MRTTVDSVGFSWKHTLLYRVMFGFGLLGLIGLFFPEWLSWSPIEIRTILIVCVVVLAITLIALFAWSLGLNLGSKELTVTDGEDVLLTIKYAEIKKVTLNPLWGNLYFKMKNSQKIIMVKGVTRAIKAYRGMLEKID